MKKRPYATRDKMPHPWYRGRVQKGFKEKMASKEATVWKALLAESNLFSASRWPEVQDLPPD